MCLLIYVPYVFDHCMVILSDVFVFPPAQSNYPPLFDEGKFVIVLFPEPSNQKTDKVETTIVILTPKTIAIIK